MEEKLAEIKHKLKKARKEWMKRDAQRQVYLKQLSDIEQELANLEKVQDLLQKVRLLFQKASEYARLQAKQQLETTVTNALQYVFGPEFRFEIELSDSSRNPTAEFYVVTEWNGQVIRNKPQDARGGGVVDIISLALRIALLQMIRPRPEGPILLDEPGKHVSEDYIVPMVEFLRSVTETFGRQIIMVTHNTHLTESADRAFHVRLTGGKSEVTVVSTS
jgi:DNA repair exonuclease SbcCD ATPase subunit